MQSLLDTAHSPPPLGHAEGRGHKSPSLVGRHISSHVEGSQPLRQKETSTTAWASASSSSSSSGVADCPVGSVALRRCLDLLVRVQNTQSESVAMLTALRERLFPAPQCVDGPPHAPVVAFDDVDREVVRLRILEVKLSGLTPKLSESIESVLLPFQFCLRQESGAAATFSGAGGVSEVLWGPCSRVASLREQFMGLAQLQEEAMQSLGMQLSELFAPSAANSGGPYYYYHPAVAKAEDGDGMHGPRERRPHDAVLRFLEQLEDVMASKQHIVVCLAMALREIYDPVAPTSALSSSVPPVVTRGGGGGALGVFNGEDAPTARVSVSVSPLSTLHPSCSAPREDSLRSPTAESDGRALVRLLRAGQVQECRGGGGGSSRERPEVGGSPSPKASGCEVSPDALPCGDRKAGTMESSPRREDRPSYICLQPPCDCDISPESGDPRSPSACTGAARAVSASPPPPLARCLEKQTEEGPQVASDADRWLRQKRGKGERESIADEVPQPPPEPSPSLSMSGKESGDEAPAHERRRRESTSDVAAENARLVRLLEAKDGLILGMQERLLGAVPLLVERLGSNGPRSGSSGGHNSNCSCRSRCSSIHGDSADEGPSSSPPPPRTRAASTSKCRGGTVSRIEQAPHVERGDDPSELAVLKDRLAAHMEDNHRLRAALHDMKEEKQRWKRAARELKEDNQMWRERERQARTRCERLEDDIFLLKKRLLKSEGALMLRDAAFASVTREEGPLLGTSSSHQLRTNVRKKANNGETAGRLSCDEAGGSLSPTRSRSRTLPPPLPSDVAVPCTSASLQEKRHQLLAKLGRHAEEGTLPRAKPSVIECEEPIVVVSPLTDERVPVGGGGAAPTTPPPSAPSFPSPSGAVRIDRRLSPEYFSPQAEHAACVRGGVCGAGAASARLSTAEVDRILASARRLLNSVGSKRNGHREAFSAATAKLTFTTASDSVGSDGASTISGDTDGGHHRRGPAARYTVASAEGEGEGGLLPPQRCSISPCSSVSYSSAKKRAQRPPRQLGRSETNVVNGTQRRTDASSSPSPRQTRGKGKSTPSPGEQRSDKPRPKTAREALMRELRDQLRLLQSQHASVLNQEEQLRLKRKQVVSAIQRHSDGGSGSSPRTTGKKCLALTALLKRLDTTQERVQKKETRLREYVEIVRRQLKTLEDDLV